MTATRKVDKPALRRALWHGPDRVLERIGSRFVEVDDARRSEILASFAEHGRTALVS